MSVLDWILVVLLITLYVGCLMTVCGLTFQKGYIALGIVGIFIPWLWLIGALLPAKRGSAYEAKQAMRQQAWANQASPSDHAGQAGPSTA